ncbi:Mur ligase family protein [Patescibacteria group bacterium]|nr:Mur ligase family protein [Patescibacteria group bacterium]
MNIFLQFLTAVWFLRIFGNVCSFARLWYIKEYRFDRMRIHLGTPEGRRLYVPPWRRPPVSPKSVSLIGGTLVVLGAFFLVIPLPLILRLVLVDILSFPVTALIVGCLRMPTWVYHRVIIARAVSLLRHHRPMVVIGITGSYGKTSVKEYLGTILGSQYRVLTTEASKNAPIGIAEVIIRRLQPEHGYFIVEMGAYKPGEIRFMADMVRPEIGIVTAINAQHQDLFGSVEGTVRAKYELLGGLSGMRIGVMNTDNSYVCHMARDARKDGVHVWAVGRGKQTGDAAEEAITFGSVKDTPDGVTFEVQYRGKRATVTAHVLGLHQATNIALAIAAACAAGMKFSDAVRAAEMIRPYRKTMEPFKTSGGALVINDTFNNNPDAALAAIAYLASRPHGRFLVFQPMIELGSFAAESHRRVGEAAGRVCDGIILTNSDHEKEFLSGVRGSGGAATVSVLTAREGARRLYSAVTSGDTVLFKGKESETMLRRFMELAAATKP